MLAKEEGLEKGRELEKRIFVRNLLLNTDFTVSKIAMLANVDEGFVKTINQELSK